MKPDEQRIAIAKACGWTEIHIASDCDLGEFLVGQHPTLQRAQTVPDYLNDLNAMAEVTRVDDNYVPVHNFNLGDYIKELATLVRAEVYDEPDTGDFFLISNATAAQRAEAFLRAKHLWAD